MPNSHFECDLQYVYQIFICSDCCLQLVIWIMLNNILSNYYKTNSTISIYAVCALHMHSIKVVCVHEICQNTQYNIPQSNVFDLIFQYDDLKSFKTSWLYLIRLQKMSNVHFCFFWELDATCWINCSVTRSCGNNGAQSCLKCLSCSMLFFLIVCKYPILNKFSSMTCLIF